MKQLIKSMLGSRNALYRLLRRIYYYWRPEVRSIPIILANYNAVKESVSFIQVGSNDGISGDPITQYIQSGNWSGILVEPVKYLFDRLKNNYAAFREKLCFENVAIAKNSGTLTFYRLDTDNRSDLPRWYEQLGSFSKEVVLSNKADIPNLEDLLMEEQVQVITFGELICKNQIQTIDLIHIDTEGYDFEVIKLIDFSKIKPELLLFEHKHLSRKDYLDCLRFLKNYDYWFVYYGADTLAINKGFLTRHPSLLTES